MRSGTSGAAKNRNRFALIKKLSQFFGLVIGRTHHRVARKDGCARLTVGCRLQGDITWNRHYGHPFIRERGLDGDLQYPRNLRRLGNQFAVMTTLPEKLIRMRLLKIVAADLLAGNLSRQSQYRDSATMAIVKPIDQMHIAGATTPGADRQFTRQMRLRAGSKCSGLFMAHSYPLDFLATPNLFQNTV